LNSGRADPANSRAQSHPGLAFIATSRESVRVSEQDGLHAELARLRKGRGVQSPDIAGLAGPALRGLCAIQDRDPAPVVRGKLAARLRSLAGALPPDLELAALAALGLHPDAQHALLSRRLLWLSERIGRDERTARRRADQAVARLAELAAHLASPDIADGWTVRNFTADVRFGATGYEVAENRVIVAAHDGLSRVVASLSLPPHGRGDSPEPEVELVRGGVITATERSSASHFRYVIDLPAALREGEEHEYLLRIRVADARSVRPYYVFTPRRRCDRFDLTVRFPRDRPPHAVYPVDKAHIRVLDDGVPTGDPIPADRSGKVETRFSELVPGLCYGLRWIPR